MVFLFQSTLPREERQSFCSYFKSVSKFQSTLPREERLGHAPSDDIALIISIHAPTRGATSAFIKNTIEEIISIHAPTRGATVYFVQHNYPLIFQSTLPREERHTRTVVIVVLDISIHAPTRGATSYTKSFSTDLPYFNPRSHERSDSNIAQKICLFLYNTDNKYIIR